MFGVPVAPDGRRAEVLNLGGVLVYDLPARGASVKIKALGTVINDNSPSRSACFSGGTGSSEPTRPVAAAGAGA